MEILAEFLTEQCLKRNIIEGTTKEICKTGLNLILSETIIFLIILIIGWISKTFIYACIYLTMMTLVRQFCGGYHAKTYGVCRLVTIGIYLMVTLINSFIINNQITYIIVFDVISIITMIIFAPVRHPNKKLTIISIRANRLFSLITTIFFSIISVILYLLHRKEGLIISLILLAITILMYVGLLANRKEDRI